MGFEIIALGRAASRLRVFIDYDYPAAIAAKFLGPMFGPIYARWCVNRMANDAKNAFEGSAVIDRRRMSQNMPDPIAAPVG